MLPPELVLGERSGSRSGMAQTPPGGAEVMELLEAADRELYAGKPGGRRRLGGDRAPPRREAAQGAQDRARRGRAVERVEVDAGRAVGQQVGALHRRVGDAEVRDRVRLLGAQLELAQQAGRDRRAAHLREAPDLVDVRDRHDARDDRDVDPGVPRAGHEVVVELVVEEQLGDQEARAGVDLLARVAQVGLGRLGREMDLGEAGRADREVVVGADQLDQLA